MKQPSNNTIRALSDDEVLAVTGGHAGPSGGGDGISPIQPGTSSGFARGSLSHDGSGNTTQTVGIGMGKGMSASAAATPPITPPAP